MKDCVKLLFINITINTYLFGNESPITFDTEIEVRVFVVLATADEMGELTLKLFFTSEHEVSNSHPNKISLQVFK